MRRSALLLRMGAYACSVALPAGVALATIPTIEKRLDASAFGALSFVWVFLGFLANADVGIGRALGRRVAQDGYRQSFKTIRAGFAAQAILGLAVGMAVCVAAFLAPTSTSLEIPLWIMLGAAFTLPLAVVFSGVRFVMDASNRQMIAASLSALINTISYIIPLIVILSDGSLSEALLLLIVLRTVVFIVSIVMAIPLKMLFVGGFVELFSEIKKLLKFGFWVMTSSVIAAANGFGDKLYAPTRIPLASLAAYSVPFDLLSKLTVGPAIIVRVLSPTYDASSRVAVSKSIHQLGLMLSVAFCAMCLVLSLFINTGFTMWMPSTNGGHMGEYAEVLLLGIASTSFAYMAAMYLLTSGHPHLPAIVQGFLLIPYCCCIFLSVQKLSVSGLVYAWSARMIAETIILCIASAVYTPYKRTSWLLLAGGIVCSVWACVDIFQG